MAAEPPWKDNAIAVERIEGTDDGEIIVEGTLRTVALSVALLPDRLRRRTRISLPDRGAPPFSYAGVDLAFLLALLPVEVD